MMLILLFGAVLVPLAAAVIFIPLVMGVRANRVGRREHALRHAHGSRVEVARAHEPHSPARRR